MKHTRTPLIILLTLIIVAFFAWYATYVHAILANEQVFDESTTHFIAPFQIRPQVIIPHLNYIIPEGSPHAQTSIVAYLQPQEIDLFFSTYYNSLHRDFLSTNTSQLYYTIALTRKDITLNTATFAHALSLACTAQVAPEEYQEHFKSIPAEQVRPLQEACIREELAQTLKQSVIERELLGIAGTTPYILVGVAGASNTHHAGFVTYKNLQQSIQLTIPLAG